MRDDERHAHPVYNANLPRGLDARLSWPDAGLRFTGTTPYGVLIQAWVSPDSSPGPRGGGEVHVQLWSTRYWDVTSVTSVPYNRKRPGRSVSRRPGCDPHPGRPGFSVQVVRDLHHGDLDRTSTTSTTYAPVDTLICRRPRR
jgi:hypothetical protein